MKFRTPPSARLPRREEAMKFAISALIATLMAGSGWAEDCSLRDRLTGKWQADGNGETWILQEAGDSIHVSNSKDAKVLVEFDCNTVGQECAIKRSGPKSTVSMWFNGPKLVELETMGNQVVKRRFTVTGSGDTMDLEIIPVAPGGPGLTTHLRRVAAEVAKQ